MSSLLTVNNLSVEFQGGNKAVDDISFSVAQGEAVAVVGESGSGKSVTALSLTRLLPQPPACTIGGRILYREKNLLTASSREIRAVRGKEIAYIFQEPSTSLNPVFSIGYQIAEVIKLHRPEIKDVNAEIIRVLSLVGIRNPGQRLKDYPHQFSGGMQQRAMIAMALACQPQLLVADEPTTALDVTIQAQIIDLLKELKQKTGMSVLLITHNFGIISGFADRVIVIFRGKIVEEGATQEILKNPRHPYTKALIECIPQLGQKKKRLTTIDYSKITELQ
jgi:ABC-type dipeptide/oligopeptide/nickel transport system ATPase component